MKLYAWIDDNAIITTPVLEYAPVGAQEYNVLHVEQLVIDEGRIIVDYEQPSAVKTAKQAGTDLRSEVILKASIESHIIDKEFVAAGLKEGTSLTEDQYLELLTEYKEVVDRLNN